jgi:shikimate kinase
MITLLVGHRGTGKTQLLERLQTYFGASGCLTFDLDAEISKGEKLSIEQIFLQKGEAEFRKLESVYLQKIVGAHSMVATPVYIAAGAGFRGEVPSSVQVLWVKRATDSKGRIFLNRPRLNSTLSALQEYTERYALREAHYQAQANQTLIVSEGFDSPNDAEKKFFRNEIRNLGADLTLLPENFSDLPSFLKQRLDWGVRRIELRDDLLSKEQIHLALALLPVDRVLFSFRKIERVADSQKLVAEKGLNFDWPNELPVSLLKGEPQFFSMHNPQHHSLSENLKYAEAFQVQHPLCTLKIALPVPNFSDLQVGHLWWQQDIEKRVFLPQSPEGRWSWYRLWQQPHLKLNFIREGIGSSFDQPTLIEWLRRQSCQPASNFAAILGDPVEHSRTPAEHCRFFEKQKYPVLAIRLSEEEWDTGFEFLKNCGLKAAAVTAPLKHKAYLSSSELSQTAHDMKAVNTLWLSDQGVKGHNTDLAGFEFLRNKTKEIYGEEKFKASSVGIWGGGGTLEVLKRLFPGALLFSAQTGLLRESLTLDPGSVSPPLETEILVWAVGRSRFKGRWPHWSPKLIIDLNYSDDSPGIELAVQTGAIYQSGLAMFQAQAQKQREFWKQYL